MLLGLAKPLKHLEPGGQYLMTHENGVRGSHVSKDMEIRMHRWWSLFRGLPL